MSNELLVKARNIQRELGCDFTRAFQIATGRLKQVSATNSAALPPRDKDAELLAIAKKIQAQKDVNFHQAWCEAARLNPELLKPEPTKEDVSAQNAAAESYRRRLTCANNIMERERCEFAEAWLRACELNPAPADQVKRKEKPQLLTAQVATSANIPITRGPFAALGARPGEPEKGGTAIGIGIDNLDNSHPT